MDTQPPEPITYDRLHTSPAMRTLLWAGGVVALALGAIGVVLPGLPTTPFVLLAGACFVRASPRSHAWLLRSKTFGPLLREWEQHRSVSRRVKRFAIGMMLATGSASVWFLDGRPWLQGLVAIGMLSGAAMVVRLSSRR